MCFVQMRTEKTAYKLHCSIRGVLYLKFVSQNKPLEEIKIPLIQKKHTARDLIRVFDDNNMPVGIIFLTQMAQWDVFISS